MKKLKIAALTLFTGSVFCLLGSVQVWAGTYTGDKKTSDFTQGEWVYFGDTDGGEHTINLTIDDTKTVQYINVYKGTTLTITGNGNNELTVSNAIMCPPNTDLTIKSGRIVCAYIQSNGIVRIKGGNVNATLGGYTNAIYVDKLHISGKNTVVTAKAGLAISWGSEFKLSPSLKITKPEGGGISSNGLFIAEPAGSDTPAHEVVIENGSPEEPAATATTEKAIGRYDSKDDDDTVQEYTKAAPVNKDALVITKMSGFPAGTFFAKQEQGIAAKNAFLGALPAGYKSAFTFNVITNGVSADYSLKNGSFTLLIPEEYRKSGRTFAISCIDKSGNVRILYDTDTDPNTISVDVNFEGFAFDLIYKD